MKDPQYKIRRVWDDEKAEYRYVLSERNFNHMKPYGHNEEKPYVYLAKASGDREWAKKNAKHYDIDIELEDAYLYELPRSKEGINIYGLKNGDGEDVIVKFHRIDGAYSYCKVDGETVHLHASTKLVKHEDGYKVVEEEE